MSDTTDHYVKMRKRAGNLRNRLDEIIHDLVSAESDVREIAKADFGHPAELSDMDQTHLERSIADALYFTKMAEEINNGHITDLERELRKLGVDPLSIPAAEDAHQT